MLVTDGTVPPGGRFLGNDKNVAYGPWVAHVWAPPAEASIGSASKTFVVRCEVRTAPDAEPVVAEREVRSSIPMRSLRRGRTYLISASGNTVPTLSDPAWEPAAYPGATFATASTRPGRRHARQARAPDYPARFLFRRGETHNHVTGGKGSSRPRPHRPPADRRLRGGCAAAPRWTPMAGRGSSVQFGEADGPENECAYWGFDLVGPYDPSDPFSIREKPENGLNVSWGRYKTVWDVSITGFDSLTHGPAAAAGWRVAARNTVIGNTFLGDWYNYGIFWYDETEAVGHCGLWVKQHPKTRIGAGKNDPGNKDQIYGADGRAGLLRRPWALPVLDPGRGARRLQPRRPAQRQQLARRHTALPAPRHRGATRPAHLPGELRSRPWRERSGRASRGRGLQHMTRQVQGDAEALPLRQDLRGAAAGGRLGHVGDGRRARHRHPQHDQRDPQFPGDGPDRRYLDPGRRDRPLRSCGPSIPRSWDTASNSTTSPLPICASRERGGPSSPSRSIPRRSTGSPTWSSTTT